MPGRVSGGQRKIWNKGRNNDEQDDRRDSLTLDIFLKTIEYQMIHSAKVRPEVEKISKNLDKFI